MGKGLGWVLLVVGLALAGYGVAQFAMDSVPAGPLPPPLAQGGSLAVGFVLVVFSLVLLIRTPRVAPAPAPAPPAPAAPEVVEVKRTEMNWASRPEAADDSDALVEVRQKMGRLKVQYGLGEVGNESYKRQMADLEAQEAEIEKARE